jgi:aminoglycoside phosphotransferase (APT) family kinase protein
LPDPHSLPVTELDACTARSWATDHLGFEPASVRTLSGGVSSVVFLAERGRRRVVIKQALPQLRVQAEWTCDRRRALREALALRELGAVLQPAMIPVLVAEDPGQYAFAMSAAPENAGSWKDRLLRGQCERAVAGAAGETLAVLIERTAGRFQTEFGDIGIFDDLRLDAYYRYTAARHPDLGWYFESLIRDCTERRHSVVHGDYSPKNMLTDGSAAMVIDWECVHYGNPAFDAAFLLNHLLLKSFHLPAQAPGFAILADEFAAALSPVSADWFLESALRHWPGLLLARMDGKSPVEYIRDEKLREGIREFARNLMTRPAMSVSEVFERRMNW